MGVLNGQVANQTTFNNAFVSRTAATTSTIAELALQAPSSTNITDTQQFQNDLADTVGMVENDPARKNYSSNNYLVDGENHKAGLEHLDVVAGDHETRVSNLEANNSQDITLQPVGSSPAPEGASLAGQALTLQPANATNPGVVTAGAQTIGGDKTFQDDVIIQGNLDVQGSLTTLNTATLEVEDQNILVNNGGNDASAEEAGIDVERTTTNAGLRFDSTLASKWKAGLIGSLSEVMTVGVLQTVTGQKIFSGRTDWQNLTVGDVATNSTLTGTGQTLPAPAKRVLRLTNSGLVSIADLSGGVDSQEFILVNATGNSVDIADSDTSGTSIRTGTGLTLTLTNNASVWLYKDPTSARWRIIGGSGSGSGSGASATNLIPTGNAETTNPFTPYADAAGVRPVDATGGSPTVSASISTSSPLEGTKSFLLTKPASNVQGEGWAILVDIPLSRRGKPLQLGFDLALNSGTFAGSSVPATDSDIVMTIYDVTNSRQLEFAPKNIESMVSGLSYMWRGTYQPDTNTAQIRIAFHVATTSATAYELKLDNLVFDRPVVSNGAAITDWQRFTLNIAGATSNPTKGTPSQDYARWRRVGDSMEIAYNYWQSALGSAAAGSGAYLFPLPAGYEIDTSRLIANPNANVAGTVGVASVSGNATGGMTGAVFAYSTTQLGLYVSDDANAPAVVGSTFVQLNQTDVTYSYTAMVPILGWSSNVQMSNDTDTRVVAAVTTLASASHTSSGSWQTLPSSTWTVAGDTHAGFTNGVYTVQTPGWHKITGYVAFVSNATGVRGARAILNGVTQSASDIRAAVSGDSTFVALNYLEFFGAGQTIVVQAFQSSGGSLAYENANTRIIVERLSGPSQIAASETISAHYSVGTGGLLFNSGSPGRINFDTKVDDTHGAVTTGVGVWAFTAPEAARYLLNVMSLANPSSNLNTVSLLRVQYTGGSRDIGWNYNNDLNTQNRSGSTQVKLLAGQTVYVQAVTNDASNNTVQAGGVIQITKIGNY